ncbi:MAG: CHRD domain-containing protein [Limisphaerales bacterium]
MRVGNAIRLGLITMGLWSGWVCAHPTINLRSTPQSAQMVPPVQSVRTGEAFFNYNPNAAEGGLFLSYNMQFPGLDFDGLQTPNDSSDDVLSISLRVGAVGENGITVLNIFGPRQDDSQMVAFPQDAFLLGKWDDSDENLAGLSGTHTIKLSDALSDLLSDRIYLQVNTGAFPNGEIRGQIENPPPLIVPLRLDGGALQLTIDHRTLREYRVEYSSDFMTWNSLTNIFALTTQVRAVDFGTVGQSNRFYRIRELVILPLHIDTQPASQAVGTGGDVEFSVAVSGTGSISYQWHFNDEPISNATNATHSISSINAGGAGNYHVTITNPAGTISSQPAALTVLP